jgi:flagellar biosynthesis/type III secretory pathway protein FliH
MCLSSRHSPDNKDIDETMTDQAPPPPPQDDDQEENEVLRAARERQQQREAAEATEKADQEAAKGKRAGWKTAAAAGLGIGSAAVIAALLYVNRDKIK